MSYKQRSKNHTCILAKYMFKVSAFRLDTRTQTGAPLSDCSINNTLVKFTVTSRWDVVSSLCDHSMPTCLLWQCLTVPSLLQLCWELTHLFSLLSTKHAESFSVLSSQRPQDAILYSSWVSSFHSRTRLQATLALSLVLSSLKSVYAVTFPYILQWCPDCLPSI